MKMTETLTRVAHATRLHRLTRRTALLVLFAAVTNCSAGTINVPVQSPTIQEAIELADSGDTILIAPGRYYERISFLGKAATVAGWFLIYGDPSLVAATVIDGNPDTLGQADTGSVVRFVNEEGAGSILCGLTVQNGAGTHRAGTGGVFYHGGGVLCVGSSPIIEDCIIRQNSVSGTGGGLYMSEGSTPHLVNCTIEDNQCGMLGGALEAIYSAPILNHCLIQRNSAVFPFGAVAGCDFFYSTPALTDCRFIGNNAAVVIGGVSCYASPALLDHCVFIGNAANFAGGFYCYGAAPTLINCAFVFNSAPNGAGIYSELCAFNLGNSIVAFNQQGAGVVPMFESAPDITCTDIYGNTGGDWIGGIALQADQNGNLSADPLFCDALNGDFHVDWLSPCAPGQNSCASLIGALDAACFGTLRASVVPDTLHAFDANGLNALVITVLLGDFTAGYSVDDIDLASLRVNDSLAPDSVAVLLGYPGFVGQVIAMYYAADRFISSFGPLWDVTTKPCIVIGLFNDKSDISLTAIVTLIGHISGDLNSDGVRDISDLVAAVDYFFDSGNEPLSLPALDFDRNGRIDITDLVRLVELMFGGGAPEPVHSRLIRLRSL